MAKKKSSLVQRSGGFVPVYYDLMDSPAYKSLSPKARCLMLELHRLEYPNRNGHIVMSEQQAAIALGCAKNTASKAFEELIDRRFIKKSQEGNWYLKKATEWTLTFLKVNGREPTDDWKDWKK